jgi:hypothetical protein
MAWRAALCIVEISWPVLQRFSSDLTKAHDVSTLVKSPANDSPDSIQLAGCASIPIRRIVVCAGWNAESSRKAIHDCVVGELSSVARVSLLASSASEVISRLITNVRHADTAGIKSQVMSAAVGYLGVVSFAFA